jgi:site-specific DNA-methyltransferase (cytosine-N4-specific)
MKAGTVASPVRTILGDALSGLKQVATASAQVCATSPPFYLLRCDDTQTAWPDGWTGELGHEEHPNDYVRHLLFIFDEVWRVLEDDGCLWVNLADTFHNKQASLIESSQPAQWARQDRVRRWTQSRLWQAAAI